MGAKLYIVEGLPCSGKSTTARYIAGRAGGRFFDEDCAEHPADYTFHAFIPDGAGFRRRSRRDLRFQLRAYAESHVRNDDEVRHDD